MIPFAAWSKSKSDVDDHSLNCAPFQVSINHATELETELSDVVDALVANLMTSNVVSLRKTLEQLVSHWSTKQLHAQEVRIKTELGRVQEEIMSMVSDALLPVLNELQLREVIKEFASTLQKTLPEFADQNLVIKAPSDIHEMLSQALHDQEIAAEIMPSDAKDISIAGNQIVINANLDAWTLKLQEIVKL